MTWRRGLAAAAALVGAVAAAGCGLGAGASSKGTAALTVTRNYGAATLLDAREHDAPESETVIRFLDREAEITTRYGGGFVQSIDGVSGRAVGGRRSDWFFYVNGIESSVGAAEVRVHGGDRIWWDYRDWTDAMRVPAVVGSWPEPFLNGAEGRRVSLQCFQRDACTEVTRALADEGVRTASPTAAERRSDLAGGPRMLVGPWSRVAADRAAEQLAAGPTESGVFARFRSEGGRQALVLLDRRAEPARTLRDGSGLVAAVREGDAAPTWLVTGTDPGGVRRAAALLDEEDLRNRYAVAAPPHGGPIGAPIVTDVGAEAR